MGSKLPDTVKSAAVMMLGVRQRYGRAVDPVAALCFAVQVLNAEADKAEEARLRQFLYRSFNEPSSAETDCSPLLRHSVRTTRTNPLL